MRYLLIVAAFALQGCVPDAASELVEAPESGVQAPSAAPQSEIWQSFIKQRRSPRNLMPDTVPKISIDTAFEICRDALANGMKLPPIIEKYGAPHFYNNLPSKKSASWPLASNAMDIRSFQVFYNKSGELTQVALFGQDFKLMAGIVYWMDEHEYCVLGIKHESRPRPRPRL